MTNNNIFREAVELPPLEKAKLIDILYDSFDNEIENEILEKWVAEAEDRIDAYDKGELKAESYEDIKKSIK